jgi:DNA-directed RNA polymerase specialized sigma24 family protein
MMTTELDHLMEGRGERDDVDLVSRSLAGDREAFAGIVEAYQSLVCSLAYSATGSVFQSEDLAQQTFLIAWKELRQLREPAKLRPWLCSVARSVISRALRRRLRDPAQNAEPLESAQTESAPDPTPSEAVIQESIFFSSVPLIMRLAILLGIAGLFVDIVALWLIRKRKRAQGNRGN